MSTRSRKPKTPVKAPKKPVKKPKKPAGKGFGTSSTEQENHVHVGPDMMPDLYGNEFMKTMLA